MLRSFRNVFTLVVVAAATLPVLILAYVFIGRMSEMTFSSSYRELELLANGVANNLGHDFDRLTDQTRAAAADSDVRRSVSSVLFLGRADMRLAELIDGNPAASAVFLLDASGNVVTAAPSTALANTPSAQVVERATTMIRENQKTLDLVDGNDTLTLVMPVAGAVGKASGALVALVPIEGLLKLAGPALPQDAIVELNRGEKRWTTAITQGHALLTAKAALVPDRLRAFGALLDVTVGEPRQKRFEPVRRSVNQSTMFVILAVMLFAIIGYLLARRLLRPLGVLSTQASDYARGIYDAPRPNAGFIEFDGVSEILSDMAEHILRHIASERARLEAEMNALRSQMSPHFLFNTLNGLATMAGIDQDRTAAMLTKLASLYRLILESSKSTTSPLDRELEIATLYLELEAVRFGKRLRYTVTAEGIRTGSIRIPGLILQTLVENAVKHGIGKAREGGEIHLLVEQAERGYRMTVRNTGGVYAPREDGGIGIANTKKRLDLLYGESHRFTIGTNAAGETEVSFYIFDEQTGEGMSK